MQHVVNCCQWTFKLKCVRIHNTKADEYLVSESVTQILMNVQSLATFVALSETNEYSLTECYTTANEYSNSRKIYCTGSEDSEPNNSTSVSLRKKQQTIQSLFEAKGGLECLRCISKQRELISAWMMSRECTLGRVYVPSVYLHARWELQQVIHTWLWCIRIQMGTPHQQHLHSQWWAFVLPRSGWVHRTRWPVWPGYRRFAQRQDSSSWMVIESSQLLAPFRLVLEVVRHLHVS